MRNSFATPYLVLTHYTDLVHTHGLVLLRGEITPSSGGVASSDGGNYLLSQEDAQALSMGVQKFYLWGESKGQQEENPERLLKVFHENPSEFKWEDLLKYGTVL